MPLSPRANLQVGPDGQLRHLLTTEGLPADTIRRILDTADQFVSVGEREVKKVPLLRGKTIFNVFFENSTRTRTTFEIAAKRLSADVINLNVGASSTTKGETLLDTVWNLQAMDADMFIVRHSQSGAPHLIARHVRPGVAVINAGDGRHAHPTQGLLDVYTIRHYKKDFSALTVAIVGDVLHSRVARSQIHALKTLGVPDLRVTILVWLAAGLAAGSILGVAGGTWAGADRRWRPLAAALLSGGLLAEAAYYANDLANCDCLDATRPALYVVLINFAVALVAPIILVASGSRLRTYAYAAGLAVGGYAAIVLVFAAVRASFFVVSG